jgi:indole-3-glycerol phosphate synthase
MDILTQIVSDKYKEVGFRKSIVPMVQLERSVLFERKSISLCDKLKVSQTGIIAEHKRRSPSKHEINQKLNVFDVAKGYETSGACGMSILTDGKYFGGSLDDLLIARASCNLPLLRKEFVIDEYQILETKAYGGDVILLIASVLKLKELKIFSELAKSIGLEVLLEVHDQIELRQSIIPSLDMIGVNNRNLKTFNVSSQISKDLANQIPNNFIKISESGINNIETIKELKSYGYQGFLIGENFMKTDNPGSSAKQFINALK